MAKKEKKEKNGEEKAGGKILSFIIVLLIVVVWLAVIALLVKMDVGGFGSNVLRPVLKDVPVVNKILPAASDEEVAEETDLPYTTLRQALEKINELEASNKELNDALEAANKKIDEKDKEIENLKLFETNQAEFEKKKQDFYNEVVYGENAPDADTYKEWYESIDKENAERIYRQVVAAEGSKAKYKELSNTYAAMKPQAAADALQTMTKDLDTVATILDGMTAEQRGAIMNKMKPEFAASITKRMKP